MRHVVEAGCDGATLCAFDAAALPADFDALVEQDPLGLMEDLQRQGRLWFSETAGDGNYVFHVHVDEAMPALPASSKVRRTLHAEFPVFAVPSGTLWLCGAEYTSRDPVSGSTFTPGGGLGRYSHMGGAVRLAPGSHRVRIHQQDWTDEEAPLVASPTLRERLLAVSATMLWVLGVLCASLAGLYLVIMVVLGLYHQVTSRPSPGGWLGVLMGIALFVAGLGALRLGALCDRQYRRTDAWLAREAARLEKADFIVEITTA